VDDTRDITQDGQQNVDEEVGIATALKEDTKRGENDGKDDLADVADGLLALLSPEAVHRNLAERLTKL
jgi:hypothetical protein